MSQSDAPNHDKTQPLTPLARADVEALVAVTPPVVAPPTPGALAPAPSSDAPNYVKTQPMAALVRTDAEVVKAPPPRPVEIKPPPAARPAEVKVTPRSVETPAYEQTQQLNLLQPASDAPQADAPHHDKTQRLTPLSPSDVETSQRILRPTAPPADVPAHEKTQALAPLARPDIEASQRIPLTKVSRPAAKPAAPSAETPAHEKTQSLAPLARPDVETSQRIPRATAPRPAEAKPPALSAETPAHEKTQSLAPLRPDVETSQRIPLTTVSRPAANKQPAPSAEVATHEKTQSLTPLVRPDVESSQRAPLSNVPRPAEVKTVAPPAAQRPIEVKPAAASAETPAHEKTQQLTALARPPVDAPQPALPTLPPVITRPIADVPKHEQTQSLAASRPQVTEAEDLKPLASRNAVTDRVRWVGHKFATTVLMTEILPGAAAKLRAYADLTRLNRPIGIWLLLWPVLWALWLSSGGKPDPHVFIVFVIGTVLTRSAGCAINDFADRNFDGHVQRTRNRPLVTGAVDPVEAVAICAGLGLVALGMALTLNHFTQLLTLVGGGLVVTYPFFKRFFPLPQFYLGAAFTWSVPMAFAAQTGAVPRIAMVMFMAGLLWTMAYDTMYAMVDREDDKKLGIRSSAILFGDADRFIIGIMQLMTLLALWLIGRELELGLWYGLGIAVAAIFALYQQLLIRERKPEDCFKAFLNNNYFGMSVFIGIALEYIFR